MRIFSRLVIAAGLGVAMWVSQASAQDAPPAVLVLIGADGTVRVIDGKTGKELARVAAQAQPKPGQPASDHDARR